MDSHFRVVRFLSLAQWLRKPLFVATVALGLVLPGSMPLAQTSLSDHSRTKIVLQPHPDSDSGIDVEAVVVDGRISIRASDRAPAGSSALYWISADPSTRSYRAFRLNTGFDVSDDVARIHAHLVGRGKSVTAEGIAETLQRVHSIRAKSRIARQMRESARVARSGRTGAARILASVARTSNLALFVPPRTKSSLQSEWCDGYGEAISITVDPVDIALTSVHQETAWDGLGSYMHIYHRISECDAYSSITTWYEDECDVDLTYSQLYVDDEVSGDFHNDDFPYPGEPDTTYVFQRAGVQAYDSSFVNRWTYWSAWGEAAHLLEEVFDLNSGMGACP